MTHLCLKNEYEIPYHLRCVADSAALYNATTALGVFASDITDQTPIGD